MKVIDGHLALTVLSWRGTEFADGVFLRVTLAWRADDQLRALLHRVLSPPGWKCLSNMACHFVSSLFFWWKKIMCMWMKSIMPPHFCSHADGFHSNLPRVCKRAHCLQEGEGRKAMGLGSMKVAAMLAGISAWWFFLNYIHIFFLLFYCHSHLCYLKHSAWNIPYSS